MKALVAIIATLAIAAGLSACQKEEVVVVPTPPADTVVVPTPAPAPVIVPGDAPAPEEKK